MKQVLLTLAIVLFASLPAQADQLFLTLCTYDFDQSWELVAGIRTGTGSIDGSNGIASFEMIFNGIDYGTSGDAINTITDIGLFTASDLGSGDILLSFEQDLSELTEPVVPGFGLPSTIIANGTYSTLPTEVGAPSGLFLGTNTSPYSTLIPDDVSAEVRKVLPYGDYDGDGIVSQSDMDIVLINWGTENFPGNEEALPGGFFDGTVSGGELDGVLLNWGNTYTAFPAATSIPEPATLMLVGLAAACGLGRRR